MNQVVARKGDTISSTFIGDEEKYDGFLYLGDRNKFLIYSEEGKYRVDDFVYQSEISEVWRGYDAKLERNVVIKIGLERISKTEGAEIWREANLLTQLDSPYIVRVFDFTFFSKKGRNGWSEGYPVIVMEDIKGDSVQKLLGDKALPEKTVDRLALFENVAKGIDYLHQNGISHRDIKPGNFILEKARGFVKLIDLGLAFLPAIKDRLPLGTEQFMSPRYVMECIYHNVDDLWSFLASIYYVLTDGETLLADSNSTLSRIFDTQNIDNLQINYTVHNDYLRGKYTLEQCGKLDSIFIKLAQNMKVYEFDNCIELYNYIRRRIVEIDFDKTV